MKPIHFPKENTVFANTQEEYLNLPAYKDTGPEGFVVSCWELSWLERIQALILGRIWHFQMTFHTPPQPILLTTNIPVFNNDQPTDDTQQTS